MLTESSTEDLLVLLLSLFIDVLSSAEVTKSSKEFVTMKGD